MNGIELERWEADEFIITINGRPTGSTVTFAAGESIKEWLEIAIPEMNRRTKEVIDKTMCHEYGDTILRENVHLDNCVKCELLKELGML